MLPDKSLGVREFGVVSVLFGGERARRLRASDARQVDALPKSRESPPPCHTRLLFGSEVIERHGAPVCGRFSVTQVSNRWAVRFN